MKNNKTCIDNIKFVIIKTCRKHPTIFLISIILSLLSMVSSALRILLPSVVVSGVEENMAPTATIARTGLIVFALVMINFLQMILSINHNVEKAVFRQEFALELNDKIMSCEYSMTESAQFQVRVDQVIAMAYSDQETIGVNAVQNALKEIMIAVTCIVSFFVFLQNLDVRLGFVVLIAAILSAVLSANNTKYYQKNRDKWAKNDKKLSYISQRLTESEYGKEVRISGAQEWMSAKSEQAILERGEWINKVARHSEKTEYLRIFVNFMYDIFVAVILISIIYKGDVSVSQYILYTGLVASFSSYVNRLFAACTLLSAGSKDVGMLRSVIEKENIEGDCGEKIDTREGLSVEFVNVSYTYQNGTEALKNISFKIGAKEKVAVVGENGSGKSTLIKLLCGLYRPTSGQILINGTDINDCSNEALQRAIAVVFQDFVVLPFSVAQNVAMCDEEQIDYSKVDKCLEFAGLKERIGDSGMKLLKEANEDGQELSGGQIQRLLIARALYKDAPMILLDEPTSALDPISEAQLYQKYDDLTMNKSAVFVSHRLASTKFCERILLLDKGEIIEQGTHEQLMQQGGNYMVMFETQRKQFV